MAKHPKRPRDPNQLGKLVVDLAAGNAKEAAAPASSDETTAAIAFARLGGLKGGAARAAALSADERKRIAQNAAKARWKRKRDSSE